MKLKHEHNTVSGLTTRPSDRSRLVRIRCIGLAIAVCCSFAFSTARPVTAQGLGTDFSAYKANADKPIDIEADLLEVDDQKKKATFKGNVLAKQGDFSLRTKELEVTYTGKQAIAATGASTGKGKDQPAEITRIQAKGKVLVNTRDKQTATSDWADFDVKKQVITIGGNVVLSQGDNVIRGDRLVIDLTTGKSRFEVESEKGKQRIRGLFLPKQKKKSDE